MEQINTNELCNEAGKMRKFFKAFSQIDEVLIAVQNSDVVLKQLKEQCAEKEKELLSLIGDINAADAKLSDSRKAVAEAIKEADSKKQALTASIADAEKQTEQRIKKAKDDSDKEIMEIRASVKSERHAADELIKGLKAKQVEAQKSHEAIMKGLLAEESNLEEKIKHSRSVLEALKAKLSI